MKTYRHLYETICSFENLYEAWRKARKGKRYRAQAAAFEQHQEEELWGRHCKLPDSSTNHFLSFTHNSRFSLFIKMLVHFLCNLLVIIPSQFIYMTKYFIE